MNEMYRYVLRISLITTAVVMIAFIFVRDYAFSFFSITGMENEIFWIAVGGTVIMLCTALSMISAKMLDGFGKSMYTLAFTIFKIFFEMGLIFVLTLFITGGGSVLIGIIIAEILSAIIYYVFLKHLFNTFEEKYEEKSTVKTFN
ncbi:hypothetical protein [uncultured Methanobrevibacter sp.]|uniref:hypothetical protein n=1 Tax=uncultured Methanobrevibacter sp. TaxID=253161 RepID=UPI0025F5DF0E|nr:hypothetical protein [uncultured Methanobrevibacter sp.]